MGGCGGSKQATKAPESKVAAPAQAVAAPEGDFKITIQNPNGGKSLGLVIAYPEKKYILVEGVKEDGLIASWNKNNLNSEENVQVNEGDMFVAINGVFGDSDAMLAECKTESITLVVKRAVSPGAATGVPAAESKAAGSPAADPT